MSDTRLIERWLPISALGIESTRERTPMTPFPAPNRLHVWWARRPLVAARAAVLASLLPADADREKFLHVIGIHGDPVAAKRRIAEANRTGERLGADAYGYSRAFGYAPTDEERQWLATNGSGQALTVLDPTAGGGSVPLEALRLGLSVYANDLNPVAALIERATIEWPVAYAGDLKRAVGDLGSRFVAEVRKRLGDAFPEEPGQDTRPDGYLWARTVACPYCDGLVPLSPNWRLAPDGTGVRLLPDCAGGPRTAGRVCVFEIVGSVKEQFPGTVARGDGHCPYADCGRVIDGEEIKRQAQGGRMGEQVVAVVYKRRVETRTKSGKRGRDKWVRGYRAPRPEDDNGAKIRAKLEEKLPEWDALDIVPSEPIGELSNYDRGHKLYGMCRWTDLFSPRQLLCHGVGVEVFREMLDADVAAGRLDNCRRAAYGYLALTLDTLLNYNNRAGRWDNTTGRVRSIFDRHDFAFVWSYAEMAPLVTGVGYDWAIEKTAKCIGELVALVQPDGGNGRHDLLDVAQPRPATAEPAPVTITCKSGDNLDHLNDLYLASFGPALEEFSRHWPLRRGTPRQKPEERRQRQRVLFDEPWDPYAVTPEDALDAARREVKRWRLSQLTHVKADDDLDPLTAFFVLAWDAFKAPVFAYDEALRLARAVGVDLEGGVVGRVAGKKGSDLHLWDSARRAAGGALGPADGSRGMIDALHHAAHAARGRSVAAAAEMLARAGLDRDPRFFAALEAVLEVLPPSKTFTGIALEGAVEASGSDFEALYNLYRLAYDDRIGEPDQLRLWREES